MEVIGVEVNGFDRESADALRTYLPELVMAFDDTIRLVALPHLGRTHGHVEITEVSPDGVRVAVGDASAWVEFLDPISGLDDLATATVALAQAARDLHPDEPATSLETQMASLDRQRVHHGQVLDHRALSDHLVAVRLGPFPEFGSIGWDQSLTVFTMADGRSVPDDLTLESWRAMPDDRSPRGRTYTVRRIDTDGVIEIWMALHGDDPASASSWARRCRAGDPVAVFGPRGRFAEPDPDQIDRAVLVADESALGAAAAVAEQLDPSIHVRLIGVVEGRSHRAALDLDASIDVRWLHAPVDPIDRAAVVRAHLEVLEPSRTYLWGAGEFEMCRVLRRLLRRERSVASEHVAITTYWRATDR